jgi:hypothetical protein
LREDRNVFDRIKERGEEVLTQVSAELMSNPAFTKAVEGAMRGKEMAGDAVGKALKGMNLPTRTDLKKALARIEALEAEVAALKKRAGGKGKASPKPSASAKGKKKR